MKTVLADYLESRLNEKYKDDREAWILWAVKTMRILERENGFLRAKVDSVSQIY
jgi:hypothetical protein